MRRKIKYQNTEPLLAEGKPESPVNLKYFCGANQKFHTAFSTLGDRS